MENQLKELRESCGLTQTKLAKYLGKGYSKSTISNIEKGKIQVGRNIIQRWAEICGYKYIESFEKL